MIGPNGYCSKEGPDPMVGFSRVIVGTSHFFRLTVEKSQLRVSSLNVGWNQLKFENLTKLCF